MAESTAIAEKMRKIVPIQMNVTIQSSHAMKNALIEMVIVMGWQIVPMEQMKIIVLFARLEHFTVKVESVFPVVNVAMEPWIVPIVVTSLIVVNDALLMSFLVTMEHVSISIAIVTDKPIAQMVATKETAIITIHLHSVAHNMSVLTVPVLNIPRDVTAAETAGMDRMSKIVHVDPTNSRATMDSAYRNIWYVTGNRTVEINLTNETVSLNK